MIAKVVSIGDELLIGQVVNTNASYISEKLISNGIPVKKVITIGDNEEDILAELDDSIKNFDVTIITGGLGPTHDDLTKPVLVKYFNDELILNNDVLNNVKAIFASRKVEMPESNIDQAMVPKTSRVLWNRFGTAPGIWMEKDNRVVIALPGVPYEMKAMIEEQIIGMLRERFSEKFQFVYKSKTLLTTGISESLLSEEIGDVKTIVGNNKLAFLPSPEGVRLRIDVKSEKENECLKLLEQIESKIREKVGTHIYGCNEETLAGIVGKMLKDRNLTIATAESCTGGMVSAKFTDINGSSDYFAGGIISYSNDVKINILGVSSGTIEKFGAVSEETASEMASNVRKLLKTDIGLSLTGIAGPTGGSDEKPVGLVWIGYSDRNKTISRKFLFGNDRTKNRRRASEMALFFLRNEILKY